MSAALDSTVVGPTRRLALDDCDLEVLEAGSGSPLLVLHGTIELPGRQPFHDALAQSFRVIAPSHPGMGGSTRPETIDSVEDLTYLYLDLLDNLGLDEVNLLGQSFGGWVAAEMAVRCPARVRRLVLVDALGIRPAGVGLADWLVLDPEQLRPLVWHDPTTGDRLKLPAEAATTDEELTQILIMRETATLYGWRPFFYNPRLSRWLHRISCPTLVIWGEHDGLAPRAIGEAYATGIPNARLETVAGAAHLPHLEQPDDFARRVTDFLKE